MLAIETQELRKTFGELEAVRALDLQIREGEIFSLLGPNGAGKSTTISMLCGLLASTTGDAFIFGHSIRRELQQAQHCLGVVPQEIAIYEDLSAKQNLMFWGRMYGLEGVQLKLRVAEVLELIELEARQNQASGKFSGGMKRRLNIGIALLHQPKLVILDEPTVGIDPQSRRRILDNVMQLRDAGATILYTTHYMEEAQELSDRVAIMDEGSIIAQGSHTELVHLIGEDDRLTVRVSQVEEALLEAWRSLEGVSRVAALSTEEVELLAGDSDKVLPQVFEIARKQRVSIQRLDIQEPNLETVFLHLTGKALRE